MRCAFALFQQIIRIGFFIAITLCAVFFKHPGEYLEIARRDIDDLKADIMGCWINMILFAPATAGAENQEGLIGNLVRQLDAKIEILVCQDRFLAVKLEPSGADIR